jgi:hypothetical protein
MRLFQEAKSKLLKAEALAPGSAAYCLAGLCARAAEFDECRRWLEASGEPGITISRDAMKAEEAFARIRDCDWFRRLLASPEDRVQAERCAAVDFRQTGA